MSGCAVRILATLAVAMGLFVLAMPVAAFIWGVHSLFVIKAIVGLIGYAAVLVIVGIGIKFLIEEVL